MVLGLGTDLMETRRVQESMAGRAMVLGVDRLDYSKGLEERFLAYEQYLADNPQQHEKVFMLQIAIESREDVPAYQELRSRLDAVSGRINVTPSSEPPFPSAAYIRASWA